MKRAVTGSVTACLVACTTVAAVLAAPPPSRLAAIGGLPKLPLGQRGSIAIVAQGRYGPYGTGNILPIVLRNNTRRSVAGIHVAGSALDAKGSLIVSGEDDGIQPEVVPPGGLAIGFVRFGGMNLPAATRFKLDVTDTPANQVSGFARKVDVPITTVRYATGKVVGTATNTTGKKVSPAITVFAACFSPASRLITFGKALGDTRTAAPGRAVTFTVDFTRKGTRTAPACMHVLVSMTGFSEL